MYFKKVRKELIDQDLKVSELADATGYSRTHISGVLNGRLNSFRAKKMIALVLKKDFDSLWGSETNNQEEKIN